MLEKFRTETAGRSVGGTIRSSILRHVMRNGNFMVTEIAEATGYSLTTIAKYVAELQSDGMIAELERVNLHTKGRKAIRYGVNPDSYYFLGIDMKTFELNIALINFIGEVVRIERHTDFRFENTHDALDELCNRVQRFIDTLEGIDPEKIKNELGWYPETTFEVGIEKTINWYLEHEDWMKNVTSGDYQKYYAEMYKNK